MSNRYSLAALAVACSMCWGMTGTPAAQELTEQDVVARALASNAGIRVSVNSRARDSLNLLTRLAAWLPDVSVSASTEAELTDGTTNLTAAGSVAQSVPGGGVARVSITEELLPTDATDVVVASYTQPLLHNAWRGSEPGYGIRVARIDNKVSLLGFRRNLGSSLTGIRESYWNMVAAREQLKVSEASLARLERTLASERTRYAIGEASEVDTLKASLEYLKAYRDNLRTAATCRKLLRVLANQLSVPVESLTLSSANDFSVSPLPEAGELLQSIRTYDPQRAEFELLHEKLALQLGKSRQELLPDVSVTLSHSQTAHTGDWAESKGNPVLSLVASYAFPTRERRLAVQQARLSAENSRLESEQYERELLSRFQNLVDEWETQRQSLVVAETAVTAAKRYLEASRVGYEVGSVRQLDYLAAMDSYVSEEYSLLDQKIQAKKQELVFDELTGTVFSKFGVTIE